MNNYNYKELTPFKWFILENFPLIDEDFDALTNWQLFCKLGKEINKIIDSQNNVGEQMENVTNAFIILKNYVDNLDLQDEVDNKLDEMVDDGTLLNLITNYTSIEKIYATHSDLLLDADNLADGMKVKTLGYTTVNDGGGASYYITDEINANNWQENINGLYLNLLLPQNPNLLIFGIPVVNDSDINTDFNNILTFVNSKDKTLYVNNLIISNTITIPNSANIKINNLTYTGNSNAVTITDGRFGNITIEKLTANYGSGILIDFTTAWGGQSILTFNQINSLGKCVDFTTHQTIIETKLNGVNWISSNDYGLNVSPLAGKSIGHIDFNVGRICNENGYAINLNCDNGKLTNLNFGYTSLENSKNGIYLNLDDTYTTEAITGYFRVYEIDLLNSANTGTVLKVVGKYLNVTDECVFRFDRYHYKNIDLTELVDGYWATKHTPNIAIEGSCCNGGNQVIGYHSRVMDGRLVCDYVGANPPTTVSSTQTINFETSNTNISTLINCASASSAITVTLPKSLKPGVVCKLLADGTHAVTLKAYTQETSGETHSQSGYFTTVVNNNGQCYVYWLG